MPNTSPITVNDGTADVVFSPDSVTGTHVLFANQSATSLEMRELLHVDRPANGNTLRRSIRLNVPLERTNASGEVLIEQCSAKVEFVFPASSTRAERDRLIALAQNAIQNSSLTASVANPEWFW